MRQSIRSGLQHKAAMPTRRSGRLNALSLGALAALSGVVGLAASSAAVAQISYETVAVVSSQPVYQRTRVESPQQRCVEERVYGERRGSSSQTPVIVSTILGGAIGNAVGHNKSNKRVGAVLGAVLGNSVGRDIARQKRGEEGGYYEVAERCETVFVAHDEERLIGYDVVYNYRGQQYTVRTQSDPGAELELKIDVQPVF